VDAAAASLSAPMQLEIKEAAAGTAAIVAAERRNLDGCDPHRR
jgi:hypothetical protein